MEPSGIDDLDRLMMVVVIYDQYHCGRLFARVNPLGGIKRKKGNRIDKI